MNTDPDLRSGSRSIGTGEQNFKKMLSNFAFVWVLFNLQQHRTVGKKMYPLISFKTSKGTFHILNNEFFSKLRVFLCTRESGSGFLFKIRIQIQQLSEYGSNMDPDPKSCFLTAVLFLDALSLFIVSHPDPTCQDYPVTQILLVSSFRIRSWIGKKFRIWKNPDQDLDPQHWPFV